MVDAPTRQDLFDLSCDARTQVHEYGGAAATVFDCVLYFSHLLDYRVYKAELKGDAPTAITPGVSQAKLALHGSSVPTVNKTMRFADFAVHPKHPDLIVCTVEDHKNPHPGRVLTYLVVINAQKKTVSRLVEGADFYACARFNPDGDFIVWQQW